MCMGEAQIEHVGNTGLSIADSLGGRNQTCPPNLVLISMHNLENLGGGGG